MSQAWQFLTFFIFDDLIDLRSTGQVYCRMSLTGICLMFFLWIVWCRVFLGRRSQTTIFITKYQEYILLKWLFTIDVALDHQAESLRFLHCVFALPSCFHTMLYRGKSLYIVHAQKWGVMYHFLEGRDDT